MVHHIQQQARKTEARVPRAACKGVFERLDLAHGGKVRLQRRAKGRERPRLLLLLLLRLRPARNPK